MKVEIVYADYQSNTPRAVQLAERLITQDKCAVLFGPQGSGATKAACSVAERYKVPMIAPTASSREVYDQGYKYLFGTFTPNDTLTEPLADIVTRAAPDVTSIAILARNDLFPLAIAQEMEKAAKARGIDGQQLRAIRHRHHGPRERPDGDGGGRSRNGCSRPATSTTCC